MRTVLSAHAVASRGRLGCGLVCHARVGAVGVMLAKGTILCDRDEDDEVSIVRGCGDHSRILEAEVTGLDRLRAHGQAIPGWGFGRGDCSKSKSQRSR